MIITTSTPLRQPLCITSILRTAPAFDIGRIYTPNDPSCEVGSRVELLLCLQSMLIKLTPVARLMLNFLKACEEAEKECEWMPRCGVRSLPQEGSPSKAMLVTHVVDLTRHDGVMLASWNFVWPWRWDMTCRRFRRRHQLLAQVQIRRRGTRDGQIAVWIPRGEQLQKRGAHRTHGGGQREEPQRSVAFGHTVAPRSRGSVGSFVSVTDPER